MTPVKIFGKEVGFNFGRFFDYPTSVEILTAVKILAGVFDYSTNVKILTTVEILAGVSDYPARVKILSAVKILAGFLII